MLAFDAKKHFMLLITDGECIKMIPEFHGTVLYACVMEI